MGVLSGGVEGHSLKDLLGCAAQYDKTAFGAAQTDIAHMRDYLPSTPRGAYFVFDHTNVM